LAKNSPFLTLFKKAQKIEIFEKNPKKTQKTSFLGLFKTFYNPLKLLVFIHNLLKLSKSSKILEKNIKLLKNRKKFKLSAYLIKTLIFILFKLIEIS